MHVQQKTVRIADWGIGGFNRPRNTSVPEEPLHKVRAPAAQAERLVVHAAAWPERT